jgi:RND family efflux transporter MFP subunit
MRAFPSPLLLLIIGLSLMSISCGAKKSPEAASSKYKAKVIVMKLERYDREISSFGTIAYKTKTDITATVEGTLVELPVEEGSAVKQGTLLARLKNVQLEMTKWKAESSVASARSALELAQAKLWEGRLQVESRLISVSKARIQIKQKEYEVAELESSYAKKKSLLDIGGATVGEGNSLLVGLNAQKAALAASEKDVEMQLVGMRDADLAARGRLAPKTENEKREAIVILNTESLSAEVDAARSQLDSAEMELGAVIAMMSELELKAPSSGIVGALYAGKGEHMQQNAKVMTLMSTDAVYAVFPIQESDAALMREGMGVEVGIDALKGENMSAKIDLVSPIIDSQTGAVAVKALMRNPSMRLRPGMFVRCRIDVGAPREVVKLPASAIAQKKGTSAKAFAVVNGKAFVKQVELGEEEGGSFIIEEGLRQGEMVIDSPSPLLKEGEDVETEG